MGGPVSGIKKHGPQGPHWKPPKTIPKPGRGRLKEWAEETAEDLDDWIDETVEDAMSDYDRDGWTAETVYEITVLGTIARILDWFEDELKEIAKDPPDPDYGAPVTLARRTYRIPRPPDARMGWMQRILELLFRARPYPKAILQTLEKYQGAEQAGDERAMARQAKAFWTCLVDLGFYQKAIAEELLIAVGSVAGTPRDRRVDPGRAKAARARIKRAGLPPDVVRGLRDIGLSDGEVDEVRALLLRKPHHAVKAARNSYHYRMRYYQLSWGLEMMRAIFRDSRD